MKFVRWISDQRGLSTIEYAVLFVLVVIGSIVVWKKLSASLDQQVSIGTEQFNRTLGSALARGAATSPSAASDEAPPAIAYLQVNADRSSGTTSAATGSSTPRLGNPTDPQAQAKLSTPIQAEIISTNLPSPAAIPAQQRPQTIKTPYSTAGSSAKTEATYVVGPPARPPIFHDNGFLQNPNDPTDPKPLPTRDATFDERTAYAAQVVKAEAARTATQVDWPKELTPAEYEKYLGLPDGIDTYHHFLTGNGADHQVSYEAFVRDDAAGQTVLNNAIRDTQRGSEEVYRQMIANDPSLATKPVTFEITGDAISVGDSNKYPYPDSENWQKAIGAHDIWNSAVVMVTPPATQGGSPTYSMQYNLHAEDRYNFNPGNVDIATGQPDSENGRFEESGLAHQYMNYGSVERNLSWTGGDIAKSTTIEPVQR